MKPTMPRAAFAALIAALALFSRSVLAAGPGYDVGAFLTYYQQGEGTVDLYGRQMSDISLYDYNFDANELVPATDWVVKTLTHLRQNPVPGRLNLITVVNEIQSVPPTLYSVSLLQRLLRDPTKRTLFIQQLAAAGTLADGVDLDIEMLNYDAGYVDMTDDLTLLFKDLRAALPADKKLCVDLISKTDEIHGTGARAYNWPGLAPYVDWFRILLYNMHGPWNSPGASAPFTDISDITNYALHTVGVPADKLHIAFNTFGWDFPLNNVGAAQQIDYATTLRTVANFGGAINRDPVTKALIGSYNAAGGAAHQIWIDDQQTIQAKVEYAAGLGVKHFDFYFLGTGDPLGWEWLATQTAQGQPLLFSLTPAIASLNGPGLTVTLHGANFSPGAVARWNGVPRATTVMDPQNLKMIVPASDLAGLGPNLIDVATAAGATQTIPFIVHRAAFAPIRINSGGAAYTDNVGNSWVNDFNSTGGTGFTTPINEFINGTPNLTLYRSLRYFTSQGSYDFDVVNGPYTVMLKFAALTGSPPGVFRVQINGSTVLDNFKITDEVANATALDKTFDATVADGKLHIVFIPISGRGQINALEIIAKKPPTPAITSLSQTSAPTGTAGLTLLVDGQNFEEGSVVNWNNAPRPTTLLSSGRLSAVLSSQDLSTPNVFFITVTNPDPDADPSGKATFSVIGAQLPPTIIFPPRPLTIAAGQHASFSIHAEGTNPLAYRWEIKGPLDAAFTLAPGISNTPAYVPFTTTVADSGTQFRCIVSNPAGTVTGGPATLTVLPNTPGFKPLRINAGGVDYTDDSQQLWLADTGYSNGRIFQLNSTIAGTNAPTLYRSNREGTGDFLYEFDVPNDTYSVKLKFAELTYTHAGERVFQVEGNGSVLLTSFDVIAATGAQNTALDKLTRVTVTNGKLSLHFSPQVQKPFISAIEISTAPPPPVIVSPPQNLSVDEGQRVLFRVTASGAGPLSYQWERKSPTDADFSPILLATGTVYTIPAAALAQNGWRFRCTVTDIALGGTASAAALLTVRPRASDGFSALRVNAGGDDYVDNVGNLWSFDTQFVGGSTSTTSATIAHTATPTLYRSDRLSSTSFFYEFSVPNNTYTINLKFAETQFTSAGQRTFKVLANGQAVLSNFDIFAQAGANAADDQTFGAVVTDGKLRLDFVAGVGAAKVNAIEIVQQALPALSPTISLISPSSATVGASSFTMTIAGTHFIAGSLVQWNGLTRPTTYFSDTSLTATVLAGDLVSVSTAAVTVFNPAASGGTISLPQMFTIAAPPLQPLPILVSLSRDWANRGDARFTLTVTGSNFGPLSVVQWRGSPRTTTPNGDHELSAQILDSDLASDGTVAVTVFTPAPGGGTSAPLTFTVKRIPLLQHWAPQSIQAGGPAFELQMTGSNFGPDSVALWAGQARPTRYVSDGEIWASLLAADIAQPNSYSLAVLNPAPGGLSGVQTVVVEPAPQPPAGQVTVITDLTGMRAYPNPWRADRAASNAPNGITFDNLPSGSTVKIFSAAGRWLATLGAPAGQTTWDLRNSHGDAAASGYYLYVVEDPSGGRTRGKLMLIR